MSAPPRENTPAPEPPDPDWPGTEAADPAMSVGGTLPPFTQPIGPGEAARFLGVGPAGSQTRFGDYEIVRKVDKGGMGFVYEARHIRLKKPVALKFINVGHDATPEDVERFLEEARAVAALHRHPNIVKIDNIGEHSGQHYIAMQFIRGKSLAGALSEYGSNLRRGVELLVKVAEAIAYAHKRGILHRDLKPANVLIDQEGTPYVTDFGLAKRVEPEPGAAQTIAASLVPHPDRTPGDSSEPEVGAPLGTPPYMPPEQALGRIRDTSTLSDVYGLGATLFAVLTGRPPFEGPTIGRILEGVIHRPAPAPSSLNPRVDADLDAVCKKALAKEPRDRYDSADAFARDLRRWLEGRPVHARPLSWRENASRWVRREPLKAAVIALAAFLPMLMLVVVIQTLTIRWEDIQKRNAELKLASKQQELASKQRADQLNQALHALARRKAGDTIIDLTDVVDSELRSHPEPKLRELTKTVAQHAREYFSRDIDDPGRPAPDEERHAPADLLLASDYYHLAKLDQQLGSDRRKPVQDSFQAAISALERHWAAASQGDPLRELIGRDLSRAYHELGVFLADGGDSPTAQDYYEKGLQVRESLCEPCGRHQGRRDGCDGNVEVRTELARSYGYLGDIHRGAGRLRDAESSYTRSHEIREKLVDDVKGRGRDPGGRLDVSRLELTVQLARSFGNLAWLSRHKGDLDRAIDYQERAIGHLTELLASPHEENEGTRKAKEDLASDLRQLAEFHLERGDPARARHQAEEALRRYEALTAERPYKAEYRIQQATAGLVRVAALIEVVGADRSEASRGIDDATRRLETASDFHQELSYIRASVRRDVLRARLALLASRPQVADSSLVQARDTLKAILKTNPENNDLRSDYAEVLALLAEARLAQKETAGAKDLAIDAHKEQEEVNATPEVKVNLFRVRLKRIDDLLERIEQPSR